MRLLDLSVKNVRGLTDLNLRLDGKSLVIWGPNGAGKSGVVDAIDFLFTGRIARLTGEGTAGILLSRHGPHIDHDTTSACVSATIRLNGTSEPLEVSRSMSQPDELVCPRDAEQQLAKIGDLMRRGGAILTRRDILRYIAAEAGKRADDIEQLLRLTDVDDVRTSFHRTRTNLIRKDKAARDAIALAEADVNVTLSLEAYSINGLLEAINESRQTLGGASIDVHEAKRFKEGLAPPSVSDTETPAVNFTLLQQAIQRIRQETPSCPAPELLEHDLKLRESIAKVHKNPTLLTELELLELAEDAFRFVDHSTVECPICGAHWPEGVLKSHLQAKVSSACAAQAVSKAISKHTEAMAAPIQTLQANLSTIVGGLRIPNVGIGESDIQVLDSWRGSLISFLEILTEPLQQYLDSGISSDCTSQLLAPENLNPLLDRIEQALHDALPMPTPEQTAWDKLTKLEESVRVLERRVREQGLTAVHSERSRILFSEYEKARDAVLDGMYSRVADRFVEFYSVLHAHEADNFASTLRPQGAGLTFDVDFLGRGSHPPHALHSEGHQDSMGVCLFLALNEELAPRRPRVDSL